MQAEANLESLSIPSTAQLEQQTLHLCHAGQLGYYSHQASTTRCPMRFSLFIPPLDKGRSTALLVYLSGLTCTEENFTAKAGAYKYAARLGLAIVAPDTSPRGARVADDAAYDLGQGAGFYVNASQPPWSSHYHMYSYVTEELPELLARHFAQLDTSRMGLCGHSMGGHGALTIYLRNQHRFASVSAFAPVCAPSQCSWGRKALSAYLGDDQSTWASYDASLLVGKHANPECRILIDQGEADTFLVEQLKPQLFAEACRQAGQPLELRMHKGYDHSYFFIQSFIDDHLEHHAAALRL